MSVETLAETNVDNKVYFMPKNTVYVMDYCECLFEKYFHV